VTFISLYYLCY